MWEVSVQSPLHRSRHHWYTQSQTQREYYKAIHQVMEQIFGLRTLRSSEQCTLLTEQTERLQGCTDPRQSDVVFP